jgi:hypothetical protein
MCRRYGTNTATYKKSSSRYTHHKRGASANAAGANANANANADANTSVVDGDGDGDGDGDFSSYWHCNAGIFELCYPAIAAFPADGSRGAKAQFAKANGMCLKCASEPSTRAALAREPYGCTDAAIAAACSPAGPGVDSYGDFKQGPSTCKTVLEATCGPHAHTQAGPQGSVSGAVMPISNSNFRGDWNVPKCQSCAFSGGSSRNAKLAAAHCNTSWVNAACMNLTNSTHHGGGGGGGGG